MKFLLFIYAITVVISIISVIKLTVTVKKKKDIKMNKNKTFYLFSVFALCFIPVVNISVALVSMNMIFEKAEE